MIGTRVGNYRVVEKLGDGGMGTVYRALDEMLDREVALKVMRPELTRQASLHERFRQEAIALARLHHPNIAAVFGLERNGDDLVMVMEFVRGETLESIVQRSGALSWSRAFELGAAVLEALDHAHDKGVVHRDIKPANIMLARDGVVKVMDFGIARIMGRTRQTRVGAAVGTPMYMSPEQLKGDEVDGRSDLYSLAAVLFELITGRMAFEADSDYELMMKQLNDPAPPVRGLVPDAPEIVDVILQRATAKRREQRFVDAREMRTALQHALSTAPVVRRPAPETRLAPPPAPATPYFAPSLERSPTTRETSQVAPVETRLAAPIAPATRIAANVAPSGVGAEAGRWLSDWRIWGGSAALLLVTALAVRGARNDVVPAPADTATAVRDTASRIVPGSLADTSSQGAQREAPQAMVAANTSTVGGGTERLKPLEPESPPAVRPSRPSGTSGAQRTPPRQNEAPPATTPQPPVVARQEPVDRGADRPESASAPEAAARGESSENASSAIGSAIDAFGSAVNDGATGRVESLLEADAALTKQWIDLMKEGRLQMSVSGSPDVDVAGARATARFSASLNVRSAFGANKRRTGQFVAELARSGSGWRVVRVRPVGALNLK